MQGYLKKEETGCPKLLDLMIPVSRDGWVVKKAEAEVKSNRHHSHEEKKLELRLGPPGDQDWTITKEKSDLLSSFGYLPKKPCSQNPWQLLPVMKDSSQPCSNNIVLPMVELKQSDKKTFSTAPANTASTAHKRTAPGPVVGWPPVRSFRKNITSGNCSKFVESPNVVPDNVSGQNPVENSTKNLFVKINMDGIPIGRKVDLNTCDSYDKLSCVVDNLFRGLVAAQVDCSSGGMEELEKPIEGLLGGSGEYTLVYEDNEGDRMLVGDVPWHMFISTVKRLRVLKSSEIPKLSRGGKHLRSQLMKAM